MSERKWTGLEKITASDAPRWWDDTHSEAYAEGFNEGIAVHGNDAKLMDFIRGHAEIVTAARGELLMLRVPFGKSGMTIEQYIEAALLETTDGEES